MSTLSAIVVCAVFVAALIALYVLLRRRPGDIWDWTEDAYQPQRTQSQDARRSVTRIRSRHIYWEIPE